MDDFGIPGTPSSGQAKAGFVVFFLSAFAIAFFFGFRGAGIDPFSERGLEVIGKLGPSPFFVIVGKALAFAFGCGLAGAWGFTYPRLYLMGVLGCSFAVVGGQVLYGSIFAFFWGTTWGPVLTLESALCFVLAFGMMLRVSSDRR